MSGGLETRVFYYCYCAPTHDAAERILAKGFSDERSGESHQQPGVVLHEQPGYFAQVSGQPLGVTIALPEEESEGAVIDVSDVPTGLRLFGGRGVECARHVASGPA